MNFRKRPVKFSRLLALLLLVAASVFGAGPNAHGQLVANDSLTADQMVQILVGNGITYLNPVLNCERDGAGKFRSVSSNLGLDSGIILTSGRIETTLNPFTIFGVSGPAINFASYSTNNAGDFQLDSLLQINNPNQSTTDVCILEFDFVPDGDSLIFDYVFGSEEYPEFACTGFNDIFAFLISGPGIPNATNIALVPGTNIPVAINSINDNTSGSPSCTNMGPGSPFQQYYVNNESGQTVTYDGFTTVLAARSEVIPCTTYHIKLAIADVGDQGFDSGVFLAANSFRSTNIKLKLNSSLGSNYDYLVEGCSRGVIEVNRPKKLPISQTIYLTYSGTATRNQDYLNVPDSVVIPLGDTTASFNLDPIFDGVDEGEEIIQVNVINACNGLTIDSLFFPVRDYLPSTLYSDDTTVCQRTGAILLHVGDDDNFDWTWRSELGVGSIDDPTAMRTFAYTDTSQRFIVSASLTNPFGTCYTDTSEFKVTVEPIPVVRILTPDTTVCLREPMQLRVSVGPEWFQDYNYVWVSNNRLDDPFVKEPYFFSQEFRTHQYVLSAQTPLGCTGSDTSGIIRTRPPLDIVNLTPTTTIAYGDSLRLNVDSGDYYTWAPTGSIANENVQDPLVYPKESTLYTVYAWNAEGCRDTGYVQVNIDFAMSEFIPSAFTPNGDGRNDVFKVLNLRYQTVVEFRIFNRYGQEVFATTAANQGWNGTYSNGQPAETGVYQYLIRTVRPDGRPQLYKGDLTLLR